MKKIISTVLALLLVFSLSAVAFAEDYDGREEIDDIYSATKDVIYKVGKAGADGEGFEEYEKSATSEINGSDAIKIDWKVSNVAFRAIDPSTIDGLQEDYVIPIRKWNALTKTWSQHGAYNDIDKFNFLGLDENNKATSTPKIIVEVTNYGFDSIGATMTYSGSFTETDAENSTARVANAVFEVEENDGVYSVTGYTAATLETLAADYTWNGTAWIRSIFDNAANANPGASAAAINSAIYNYTKDDVAAEDMFGYARFELAIKKSANAAGTMIDILGGTLGTATVTLGQWA